MRPALVSRLTLTIALIAVAAGCSLDVSNPQFTAFADPATTSFSPGLNVSLSSYTRVNGQLYYQDSVLGTGRIAVPGDTSYRGDSVSAFYTLWLANGNQVDRRAAPSPPFRFLLDSTRVILGWSRGLRGMRVGGIRKLVVGPGHGYGFTEQTNNGQVVIPSNSVLVFTVQLVAADTTSLRSAP